MKKGFKTLIAVGICFTAMFYFWSSFVQDPAYDNETGSWLDEQFQKVSDYFDKDLRRMKELEDDHPNSRVVDGMYDTDVIFSAICEAIEMHEDKLIVYHDTNIIDSNNRQFKVASNYQYFWLDTIRVVQNDDYTIFKFSYFYDTETTERMISEVDTVFRDIQYDLMNRENVWDTAYYLYNYLVTTTTYSDDDSLNMRNIYGALIEHEAVCAGYTAAFDYIMSRMGYDVGVAGNSDHIWNYIAWDSDDCFIDVTWADPDTYDYYNNRYINYSYFGMDLQNLELLESHTIEYAYISGRGYEHCKLDESEYNGLGTTIRNYCDNFGFNAGSYSYGYVEYIFNTQYMQNDNTLIVKFSDAYEADKASEILTANNNTELNRILTDLGYYGNYSFNTNTACNTFLVYLYRG